MAATGIHITARAMVSSLGLDAANACAAMRAGLSRATELPYVGFMSDDDGQLEYAVGHPVPVVTQGFVANARIIRLLESGLRDLAGVLDGDAGELQQGACYLSLPPEQRSCVQSRPSAGNRAESADWERDRRLEPSDVHRKLFSRACRAAQWPHAPELRCVATSEHAGGAHVLEQAVKDLQTGVVSIAIVGAVDSLVDERTLGSLYRENRLKCSSNPVGLSPGEACSFLVLERAQSMASSGRSGLAEIVAVDKDEERQPFAAGETPSGDAMFRLLLRLSNREKLTAENRWWIISDQNGEPHRGLEWGNALVRLVAELGREFDPVLWMVPQSFGDVGAASGIVSATLAISAFDRGYAPGPLAIVLSATDAAPRALLALQRPA